MRPQLLHIRLTLLTRRARRGDLRHLTPTQGQELLLLSREAAARAAFDRDLRSRARLDLMELSAAAHTALLPAPSLRRQLQEGRAHLAHTLRREWSLLALSAGVLLGAVALVVLAHSLGHPLARWALPPEHLALGPAERVASELQAGGHAQGATAPALFLQLLTSNLQAAFVLVAMGALAGLPTLLFLARNGLSLGAMAVAYHDADQGPFFYAWLLPHAVPELTAIVLSGAAGLALARGVLQPGDTRVLEALRREGAVAFILLAWAVPLFILAALVEATLSQWHAPAIPPAVKWLTAATLAAAVPIYLLAFSAQKRSSPLASRSSPMSPPESPPLDSEPTEGSRFFIL